MADNRSQPPHVSLNHWWIGIATTNVAFTFNNLVHPTGVHVKERCDAVLKFSSTKHCPNFYSIVECQPTTWLLSVIHGVFLSENAAQGA
jgi:hypothetical protein